MKKPTSLLITPKDREKLSKSQKKFNDYIKKIERQKKALLAWQEMATAFQQKQENEYIPLFEEYQQQRLELVLRFHKFSARKSFSKLQREKMAHLICDWGEDLIDDGYTEIKPIYNQYSTVEFDQLKEAENRFAEGMLRTMLKEEMDIEFDADLRITDEENVSVISEKIIEQLGIQPATPEADSLNIEQETAKSPADEEEISQSIKSVYRQLVVTLHPDREQDEVERKRKTELMQQVTQAYRDKDLLKLLALQLEVEQIDQARISSITNERLQHFNEVLEHQLDELKTEVEMFSMSFAHMVGLEHSRKPTPKQIMAFFQSNITSLQGDLEHIKAELMTLTSVKRIQEWLRDYHLPPDPLEEAFMFPPELDLFR